MKCFKFFLLLLLIFLSFACKKIQAPETEPPAPAGPQRNLAPVALLPVEKDTIILPTESIISFDASLSYDPDGKITSYRWRKISGPDYLEAFQITSQKVTYHLSDTGNYFFEVTVEDNAGSSGKDTMLITAVYDPSCSPFRIKISPKFNLITQIQDSIYIHPVVGQGRNMLFFTSGYKRSDNGQTQLYDRKVYIYDFETGLWESGQLTSERQPDGIVSDGEYVIFAGGYTNYGVPPSKRIDIFHIPSRTWSQAAMQTDRSGCAVAIIRKKVVIAGGNSTWGYPTNDIEIYDLPSAVRTRAQLSEPRSQITVINDGQKLYFGGGVVNPDPIFPDTLTFSKKIDIYDAASGKWSVSNLIRGKYNMNGISFNGKTYWAGGTNNQATEFRLEIIDPARNITEFECMENVQYQILNGVMAAVKDKQSICFINAQYNMNIYEPATKKWSFAFLPPGEARGIFNFNSKLYLITQPLIQQQINKINIFEIVF